VKPTDLRGILRYIPRFRERVFVLSCDAAVVMDENFANILLDIAVLRSLNIRVVLVHGAAAMIRQLAREAGVAVSNLDGAGTTDEITLKLSLTAANRLTHEILEGLSNNDLRAASTNAMIAHPLGIIGGVDHLFTGKVERVDSEMIQSLLGQGIVPVVPPLGFDGEGHTYRVNSDAIAVALGEALKAAKIIYITSHRGLVCGNRFIRQILASELEQLLARQRADFPPELLPKAQFAAQACRAGVARVHIINGLQDEALLAEVFSNEGIGTLVYANEYEKVRRALKKDIRQILLLTRKSVNSAELMKRTRSEIERHISDYYLYEIDRNPVACVALHLYPEHRTAELAYLFVSPAHENQGIGAKLIQYAENKAREGGVQRLIALSTQAFTYFQSKGGFVEGSPEDLPPARRERYDASGRRSKVLVKNLT
jgi:amino-acid N-acetyltransferase